MRTGTRITAAAFAVGLSLAAPQGVAVADTDDDGSATVSTGRARQADAAGPQRSADAAGPRQSATPGPRAARTARSASPAAAADLPDIPRKSARDRIDRTPATPGPSAALSAPAPKAAASPSVYRVPGPAPATAAAVSPAATVPTPAMTPAPAAGSPFQSCRRCGTFAAKTPVAGPAVNSLVRTAKLIDYVGNWLSTLPSGPATDLLSGALLLVRRNLFPTVPTIPQVTVSDATSEEGSGQVVFTVELKRAYTSTVTLGYLTDSTLTNPAAELAERDTRATAGADYQSLSGTLTFAPGETSKQVIVTVLDDSLVEAPETFSLEIVATWPRAGSAAAGDLTANATASDELTSVVLAAGTATIVDDNRVKIDVNPNFAYGDALLASVFSDLAYNHRNDANFTKLVQETGWEGIGIADANLGAGGYSPSAGGFGVRDGWTMQSYAFAGKRTAADGTAQFVVAFEGSNLPWEEPADWIVNAGEYGWSRYYASLEPLMTEVVGQMLQAQNAEQKTQLIITGHSLGGAAAMMAFADLLAPKGNLWPNTSDVLAAGGRVLDTVDAWSPEIRTALLAATSVYTFGAPSILIEPTKPGKTEALAFAALAAGSGFLGALGLLPAAIGTLSVDDKKLPNLTGIAGINFGTRVFQFEHANTSWWPPYPGDIVAQIGNRDPGTVLEINLDNEVHKAYTGLVSRYVPGATHPMTSYRESVARLITNSRLLKNPNKLSATTPKLPQTSAGNGSDTRNDFFVNLSDDGKNGNDLFVYSQAGSYTANGGLGSDAYSIGNYGVSLVIDGTKQSGRDTVVFDLSGVPGASYTADTAVFSVTGTGGARSSVTITGWDTWQVSDIFQVIKPADGQWTLDTWTDFQTPAPEQIPLSVL